MVTVVEVLVFDGNCFEVPTAVVDIESRKRNKRKIGPPYFFDFFVIYLQLFIYHLFLFFFVYMKKIYIRFFIYLFIYYFYIFR